MSKTAYQQALEYANGYKHNSKQRLWTIVWEEKEIKQSVGIPKDKFTFVPRDTDYFAIWLWDSRKNEKPHFAGYVTPQTIANRASGPTVYLRPDNPQDFLLQLPLTPGELKVVQKKKQEAKKRAQLPSRKIVPSVYTITQEVTLRDVEEALRLRQRAFLGGSWIDQKVAAFIELRTPRDLLYEQIGYNVARWWMQHRLRRVQTFRMQKIGNDHIQREAGVFQESFNQKKAALMSWVRAETRLFKMRTMSIQNIDQVMMALIDICKFDKLAVIQGRQYCTYIPGQTQPKIEELKENSVLVEIQKWYFGDAMDGVCVELPFDAAPLKALGDRQLRLVRGFAYVPWKMAIPGLPDLFYHNLLLEVHSPRSFLSHTAFAGYDNNKVRTTSEKHNFQAKTQARVDRFHKEVLNQWQVKIVDGALGIANGTEAKVGSVQDIEELPHPKCMQQLLQQYPTNNHRRILGNYAARVGIPHKKLMQALKPQIEKKYKTIEMTAKMTEKAGRELKSHYAAVKKASYNCVYMTGQKLCPYVQDHQTNPQLAFKECHGEGTKYQDEHPVNFVLKRYKGSSKMIVSDK